MRHGEAVAIGMGVAAEVARGRGMVTEAFLEAQDAALARLGLPVRIPAAAPLDRVVEAVGQDKKRRAGSTHAFVLPTPRGLTVVEDVTTMEVQAALQSRVERRGPRSGAPAAR
jgi:3-dehydroquinate synthase